MSITRQLIFVAIFISVLALTNYYVYRRFFCRLSPRFCRFGAILMLTIMSGEIVFVVDMLTGFIPESKALLLAISAFVGSTFMLFVVALAYDLTISVSKRVPFDQEHLAHEGR